MWALSVALLSPPALGQERPAPPVLPELTGAARYAIVRVGPAPGTPIWVVLAKRRASHGYPSILYFDRNGNGDLTDPEDRIGAKRAGDQGGRKSEFRLAEFTDPRTGARYEKLLVRWTRQSRLRDSFTISYHLPSGPFVKGPYATDDKVAPPSSSPEAAPQIRFAVTEGPLDVVPVSSDLSAPAGGTLEVKLYLGRRGDRDGAFACVSNKFLPSGQAVEGTLVYATKSGEEKRAAVKLAQRC
jgi:hypothetical protein